MTEVSASIASLAVLRQLLLEKVIAGQNVAMNRLDF